MRSALVMAAAAAAAAVACASAAPAAPAFPASLSSRFPKSAENLAQSDATTSATVYLTGGTYSIKMGVLDPSGVAWARYLDMADAIVSAFGELSVKTSATFTDEQQMHAAGYVEGALTAARIYQHYVNTNAWLVQQFKGGSIPQQFVDWFATQDQWARSNVAANTSSPIWRSMGLVLAQFDGLVEGYNAVASSGSNSTPPLSVFQFQQLGAMGDWLDLIPALSPSDAPNWTNMTDEELMDRVVKSTHCSALVKVNGDLTELFFAHSAWFIFQSTLRVWKHYELSLADPAVSGNSMSFSSYPGYLSSLDDWYAVWSSGLAVLETTNSIFNMSLYKLVVPQSLLAWHRVRVANLVATTGDEWASAFAAYNSGTYNNQYDVINVGAFKPGGALPDGLLTIVEQVPGLVVWGDATQELERGHFPSYNVPYFKQIYDISGYTEVIKARRPGGAELGVLAGIDYQLAPRAKIFRRDAGSVEDLDDFLAIMRYNDYKNDPYSGGSPYGAICSRGDLASNPDPGGCLDTKASVASLWATKGAYVINGPSTGGLPPGGPLPPFSWSQFPNTSHIGLPQTYDFTFELKTPLL